MRVLAVSFAAALASVLAVAALAGGPPDDRRDPPSDHALAEIPADLLSRYVDAAATCAGLPWQILAGIGFVESDHARGTADPLTGQVEPPILGPALDGSEGIEAIEDLTSADGWMHAQGPMQFLPTTWQRWARLAPGRPVGATPDPHNAWDAIYSAAAYLCAGQDRLTDLDEAILRYNRSRAYLADVRAKAVEYGLGAIGASGPMSGGLVCPVAGPVEFRDDFGEPRSGGRTHQGNDLFTAAGTPLAAVEAGVITSVNDTEVGLGGIDLWLHGDSGTDYYYAHNTVNLARPGQTVAAGQPIALAGNTGNARGGPAHLHFQMHPAGGAAASPFSALALPCRSARP
ncbi:MAG: peptidoglycan DD-metalloendopeptidase family protein [Vicinamibacterales bacterium]